MESASTKLSPVQNQGTENIIRVKSSFKKLCYIYRIQQPKNWLYRFTFHACLSVNLLTGFFVGLTVGVLVSFNVRMSPHRSEQCWNASTSLHSDRELDKARLVTIHIILVPGLQRLKVIHARNKHIYTRLLSHGKTVLNGHYWSVRCMQTKLKSLAITFVLVYTTLIYATKN